MIIPVPLKKCCSTFLGASVQLHVSSILYILYSVGRERWERPGAPGRDTCPQEPGRGRPTRAVDSSCPRAAVAAPRSTPASRRPPPCPAPARQPPTAGPPSLRRLAAPLSPSFPATAARAALRPPSSAPPRRRRGIRPAASRWRIWPAPPSDAVVRQGPRPLPLHPGRRRPPPWRIPAAPSRAR